MSNATLALTLVATVFFVAGQAAFSQRDDARADAELAKRRFEVLEAYANGVLQGRGCPMPPKELQVKP